MKVLLIDAYDSFVYTISHYYRDAGAQTRTVRVNDKPIAQLSSWQPDLLVLGPGPGTPTDHDYLEILSAVRPDQAVFGVCLGHQAIGQFFGWHLTNAPRVQHGTYFDIDHDSQGVFFRMPNPLRIVRYHSLQVQPSGTSHSPLETSAVSPADDVVMALRHRTRPIEGVQFHPESIGTKGGMQIIRNSMALASGKCGNQK